MPQYEVCPRCDGEGYVSKLGAFTGADLDEWYGDGEERYEFIEEYTRRGGIYDDKCPCCDGNRVATKSQIDDWEERESDRQIMMAESGYGYGY